MAISEFEQKRCERELDKFLNEHRPPVHLRRQVDIGYRLVSQSVELFEIRPRWDNPKETFETPIAKATFVKKHKLWRIYWYKSDMKWHSYEPCPQVKHLEEFLAVLAEDAHCCFWG